MKCKTCGKEVVHYWITHKPYCDKNCEEKNDVPDIVKDLFGTLSGKKRK